MKYQCNHTRLEIGGYGEWVDASVNEKAVEIGEIEPTVEETVHVDKGMSMDDEATESHKDEPGYGKEDEHIGTVLKDSD